MSTNNSNTTNSPSSSNSTPAASASALRHTQAGHRSPWSFYALKTNHQGKVVHQCQVYGCLYECVTRDVALLAGHQRMAHTKRANPFSSTLPLAQDPPTRGRRMAPVRRHFIEEKRGNQTVGVECKYCHVFFQQQKVVPLRLHGHLWICHPEITIDQDIGGASTLSGTIDKAPGCSTTNPSSSLCTTMSSQPSYLIGFNRAVQQPTDQMNRLSPMVGGREDPQRTLQGDYGDEGDGDQGNTNRDQPNCFVM